jgi:hypothetical protein
MRTPNPDQILVEILGNVVSKLDWQIVPRYRNDPRRQASNSDRTMAGTWSARHIPRTIARRSAALPDDNDFAAEVVSMSNIGQTCASRLVNLFFAIYEFRDASW